VLLAGFLLARFLGFSFANFQPHNTVHVVILDDRLSMEDFWKDDGEAKNSFQLAKQTIEKELAKTLLQARNPQRLIVFQLSEPGTRFDRFLTEETLRDLAGELSKMESPTALHLDMLKGVRAAGEVFEQNAADDRYLHIFSDFRQQHWSEPEASALIQEIERLKNTGVKVEHLDAAHPKAGEGQKIPLYHDNLAVAELQPETRVAAEGMPVQFTVTVANNSSSEKKNVRVTVKVDGQERPEGSLTILSVPPGRTSATFQVGFVRLGYNTITATLENEEAGLSTDNIRYAVIEVRRQVPVLVIDGDLTMGDKPGGDTFHIRSLLTSTRGYEVVRGSSTDLERPNLGQYPSIYLLNVRDLNDKALANLENYVKDGGGLVFFLGDKVNADFYNKKLYAGGKGIFPVPLADQPSKALTDEEKAEKQLQNLVEPRMQIYIRNDSHPLVAELYKYRNFLTFLNIDRYHPVPRLKMKLEPGRKFEELVTLPNDRPVSDYQTTAVEILDSLPMDDPNYEKFKPALEKHKKAIRDTLTGKSLHLLANALDNFLKDPKEAGDGEPVRLTEFWELTDEKVQALRNRVEKFRETVQYGDPLVVSQEFQKGRVVAFLTTAGKKWNDWAGGSPASVTYPMVMIDLQKYLTGGDTETAKKVGEPLEIERAAGRYESKARCYFQDAREMEGVKAPKEKETESKKPGLKDIGEIQGTSSPETIRFTFEKTSRPGVYQFDLTQRSDSGGESKIETAAFAYNVDTAKESDLRRQSRDELTRLGPIHGAESGTYNETFKRSGDFSESAWIYLIFLVVLVAEQALAVHLSFHLKASEALPVPAGKPQASAA